MLFTTKGKLVEFTKSNAILFFLDPEKIFYLFWGKKINANEKWIFDQDPPK